MQFIEKSAVDAVLHFAEHVFPGLFKGKRNPKNPEYKRVYSVIRDAKAGEVMEGRARAILLQYGGGRYRATVKFEVSVDSGEGDAADDADVVDSGA